MQAACTALRINASGGNTGPLIWEVSKNSPPKKEVYIEGGLVGFYSPCRRNSSTEAVNDGLDWKAAGSAKPQTAATPNLSSRCLLLSPSFLRGASTRERQII